MFCIEQHLAEVDTPDCYVLGLAHVTKKRRLGGEKCAPILAVLLRCFLDDEGSWFRFLPIQILVSVRVDDRGV